MDLSPVLHDTFVIERSFPKPPAVVFSALSDPEKMGRWYVPGTEQDVEEFSVDFRVGGTGLLRYRFKEGSPYPGVAITNEVRYQAIVPDQCIVTTSAMDLGATRISASLVTFELFPEDNGTRLILTHQAVFFEGSGGPEMRKQGWVTLLAKLATEVER